MTRIATGIVLAALAAACTSAVGPFVKNAWIDGDYLVVEKCTIEYSSPMGGSITERGCYHQQLRLPARLQASSSPPPSLSRPSDDRCAQPIDAWRAERDFVKKTELYNALPDECRRRVTRHESEPGASLPEAPTREQILSGLRTVSDEVLACVRTAGVDDSVTLRFSVTPAGYARRLTLDRGDDALRTCIARAIGRVRFPESRDGATLEFPFQPPPE